MTEQELKEIEARANATTPGRWMVKPSGVVSENGLHLVDRVDSCTREDAEFIAHARQDVPALIAEVRNLRRLLKLLMDSADARCQWCDMKDDCSRHAAWCPVFTPEGELK